MSVVMDSTTGPRAAARTRGDEGVIAQAAHSLHREARREREGAGRWESTREGELAFAIEARRRVRAGRARTPRSPWRPIVPV
jgi:hypothetical protein